MPNINGGCARIEHLWKTRWELNRISERRQGEEQPLHPNSLLAEEGVGVAGAIGLAQSENNVTV